MVEVSDTSLDDDLGLKAPQYARAKLSAYWVVNLKARRVEVYTDPRGGKTAGYRSRVEYVPGDAIPLSIDGEIVGAVPAAELLP